MSATRAIILALVAMTLVASLVKAQDEAAAEATDVDESEEIADDSSVERDPNAIYGVFARAVFDGQDVFAAPHFPAGEKASAYIGFSNDVKNPTYDVFFVSAYITRLGDHFNHLQNFSGIRHERSIARGETATFRYTFTPDAMLEPMEYNLVVRLFFRNDGNQTFAAVAYNSTIVVDEPLGTDPKTIMTFLTIGAIIAAVVYVYNARKPKTYKPRGKAVVESGTNQSAFDPDYVSKEHLAFRESLLRKSSASPKKH